MRIWNTDEYTIDEVCNTDEYTMDEDMQYR